MRDDEGATVLGTVVGILSALSFMALTALAGYAAWKHWNLPSCCPNQQKDDPWGKLAWLSIFGMVFTGIFTVIALDQESS